MSLDTNRPPLTADHRCARYRGRFAPSPTGALHFGSLVTAVASYLDARCRKASGCFASKNIDRPREVPGSADSIIATLAAFGFEWTGSIVRQSDRIEMLKRRLERLARAEARLSMPAAVARQSRLHRRPSLPTMSHAIQAGVAKVRSILPLSRRALQGQSGRGDRRRHNSRCRAIGRESRERRFRRSSDAMDCSPYQLAVVVDDAEQDYACRARCLLEQLVVLRFLHFICPHCFPTPAFQYN